MLWDLSAGLFAPVYQLRPAWLKGRNEHICVIAMKWAGKRRCGSRLGGGSGATAGSPGSKKPRWFVAVGFPAPHSAQTGVFSSGSCSAFQIGGLGGAAGKGHPCPYRPRPVIATGHPPGRALNPARHIVQGTGCSAPPPSLRTQEETAIPCDNPNRDETPKQSQKNPKP